MKPSFLLIFLTLWSLKAVEFLPDKQGVGYKHEEIQSIKQLSDALKKHFDATIMDRLPQKTLKEIRECNFNYWDISGEALRSTIFYIGESAEVNEAYKTLKLWADVEPGYENGILFDALTEYIKTKDIKNFDAIVQSSILKYRESKKPNIPYSPDGKNSISWLWSLKVDTREYGRLHVGIDEVKRNFLCYEADVGLYFPEGETLERIYCEIIQDPAIASMWLGKGRKEKMGKKVEGVIDKIK